jgi:hypothetical protein
MEKTNESLLRELIACQAGTQSSLKALFSRVHAFSVGQKAALLLAGCLFLSSSLYAQGETIAKLDAVKTWVNGIINIIFIIAILYAAIMCVLKFVRQEQGAWGYAFGVLIAFILWGGFTTYKNDIFALMGGGNLMVVE